MSRMIHGAWDRIKETRRNCSLQYLARHPMYRWIDAGRTRSDWSLQHTPNIHSAPKELFDPPSMKNPRANLFTACAIARKPSDRSVYSNCLNTLQMAVQSPAPALKHQTQTPGQVSSLQSTLGSAFINVVDAQPNPGWYQLGRDGRYCHRFALAIQPLRPSTFIPRNVSPNPR